MKRAVVVLMLVGVLDCDVSGAASWTINRDETPRALTTAADSPDASLPPALSLSHEITLGDLRFQSSGAAAMAFGVTGGLAVWDSHDASAKGTEQLMASAITLTGELVNPVGQPLLPTSEAPPAGVAISFFTHSDTGIIAWVDTRGNALAARIRTDGQLLDPQPLRLPDIDVGQISVTCGDHDCLVLWLQFGDLYWRAPMKGARISDSGALLDPVPLDIGVVQTGLSAIWNGSEYWIVTTADSSSANNFTRGLQLLPLRSSGLCSPITFVDEVFVGNGSIAWNGFEGLLAWNSMVGDYPSTHNEIRYSRIDGNGRLLDGAHGVLIGTAPPPVSFTDSGFPTPWDGRVTWDGMTFIVTWTGSLVSPTLSYLERSTIFERVTSAGKRLDGDFPNAGFSLRATVPAAVVGISQGRTVISYDGGVLRADLGSRMRVMQQVSGRRRSSHP
jgi:hypothetical protein